MARIGLFGGTFNPIHRGHIAVARQLRQDFPLERIYLIPARMPPHKTPRELAPAAHRLAMIELALQTVDDPGISLSDIELQRTGLSYTVDTVDAFRKGLAADDELFLILGADAFLELNTWRQWRALLASVSLIVMSRPGSFGEGGASSDWTALTAFAQSRLDAAYTFQASPCRLAHPQLPPLYLTTVADWEISSSQVRHSLRRGESVKELVPGPVAAYIASKGLYQ